MKKRIKKKILSSIKVLDKKRLTANRAKTMLGRLNLYSKLYDENLFSSYPKTYFNKNRHYYIVTFENHWLDYEFFVMRAGTFEKLSDFQRAHNIYRG